MEKKTTREWIDEARKVHGDKYDYSKVEYINKRTKVCIICPIHGEFWQLPPNHLNGCGCTKCGISTRKQNKPNTTEEFIEKANEVHTSKYNYSKVKYINNHTKVCIICPIHGEFWQLPHNHLKGQGCPICGKTQSQNKQKFSTNDFIIKAKEVHGDKYDYSKVEYTHSHDKVCIICPIHGEFWQVASEHLRGNGCAKCGRRQDNTKSFIEKARKIHEDKYDYSKVDYVNTVTKVCIICPKHGEFWQKPNDHLNGHGCPKCNESKLESEIESFLKENNLSFEKQKKFKWLGRLSLDFYLQEYNAAIECQGLQHFKEGCFKHDTLLGRMERDNRKLLLCKNNNVKIFYYSNLKINYPYKVYNDKNEMLNELKNERQPYL